MVKIAVCGTHYGSMYLWAIAAAPQEFQLVGIVAKGSDRSIASANRYQVPLYDTVEELPGDVDVACIAIGGAGPEMARKLLARGVHVLSEHPISPNDVQRCLEVARASGSCFNVNAHWADLANPRAFIHACRASLAQCAPVYLSGMATPRSLFSLIDIVGRVFRTLRPFRLQRAWSADPFSFVHATIGSTPFHLQVQSFVGPHDDGTDGLVGHQLAVFLSGRSFTLSHPNGPVVHSLTRPLREDEEFSWRQIGPGQAFNRRDIFLDRRRANQLALHRLVQQAKTKVVSYEQSEEHLFDVSSVTRQISRSIGKPQTREPEGVSTDSPARFGELEQKTPE